MLPRPSRLNHEVQNQTPPLEGANLYALDAPLQEGVRREGAAHAEARLHSFGARIGSAEVQQWAVDANRNPPVLRTHDRYGHRLDVVDFHPSYHALMTLSVGEGLHAPWRDPGPGAQVARAAAFYLSAQGDLGHGCPISMTSAIVPALASEPGLAARWTPGLGSHQYDPRFLPPEQKRGLIAGMSMTEKQGGSDVRTNTTVATPAGADGPEGQPYLLIGHKWFCSAPMSDLFLMLAQAPGGLTCFLVPRWTPDGRPNPFYIQRLKDKVGNRSNASSEIELDHTLAFRVGPEGRGVATIVEMVNHTRLDCVIASAALLRLGVSWATHHALHRAAFGRHLVDQPLMENVLADLSLESEASTALMLRLARVYDETDDRSRTLRRVLTPIAKYQVCKRAVAAAGEAMECLGGAGYVEDFPLARMYREAPVYPIWEGSGNVIALDVQRALQRTPGAQDALEAEIAPARGVDRRLDLAVDQLWTDLPDLASDPGQARRLVERLALVVQGALLVRAAPHVVAAAFCLSRLSGEHGALFGTLPKTVDTRALVARVSPEVPTA